MSEVNNNLSNESSPTGVRIKGINTDKTRKLTASDTEYEVYFELSGTPPQVWRDLFAQEWKVLNPKQPLIWPEVSIDRAFLVMHSPLEEIPTMHLPVLKQAIIATREDAWKQERKAVEDMARSMRFD